MSNDLDVALEVLEDKALVALQGRDVCIQFKIAIYLCEHKKKQNKTKKTHRYVLLSVRFRLKKETKYFHEQ